MHFHFRKLDESEMKKQIMIGFELVWQSVAFGNKIHKKRLKEMEMPSHVNQFTG